ncbi:hypothetical protein TSAR_010585, partial [Trichomalopsis sarcophagae]
KSGCEANDTLTFVVRIKKTAEYKTQNARFDRPIPDDKDVNKPARGRALELGETVSLARVNAKRVSEMARSYTPWNRSYTLIHSRTLSYVSVRSVAFPHALGNVWGSGTLLTQIHAQNRTLRTIIGKILCLLYQISNIFCLFSSLLVLLFVYYNLNSLLFLIRDVFPAVILLRMLIEFQRLF